LIITPNSETEEVYLVEKLQEFIKNKEEIEKSREEPLYDHTVIYEYNNHKYTIIKYY